MEHVFNAIMNGRALLIFGSGMNHGTFNSIGEIIPTGVELAKELYKLSEVDDPENPADLEDAADNYVRQYSEEELIAYLQKKFSIEAPSDAAKTIFSMPWIRMYTTNYDNLPLMASKASIIPVTIDEKPARHIGKKNVCVYINGYLGKLTTESLNSSFKLTTKSYLSQDNIMNSEWGDMLRQDMSRASVIVVIGLSLEYDLDLQRIIHESTKERVAIIEASSIKKNKKDKLGRYGEVFDIGIDAFSEHYCAYSKSHFPSESADRLINFKKGYTSGGIEKATGVELYDFFAWGKETELLYSKKDDGEMVIIERSGLARAMECVEQGEIRVIFLHANLGNGKSVFIKQMKRRLSEKSIANYEYKYETQAAVADDIHRIMSTVGKKVIIVENYFNHLELLKRFAHYDISEVTFVLSARTMIYDTKITDVDQILSLSEGQSEIIDINKLDDRELRKCYQLFEDNKFWGPYNSARQSAKKKALVIHDKGNQELHTILLDVIHSSDIEKRLIELTNSIKKDSGKYYRSIVIMLLSTVMSLELSVDDIHDMVGIHCINDPKFRHNPAVKEIVKFGESGVKEFAIRSSVVALEIIKMIDSDEDIIQALLDISRYANQYYEVSEKYNGVLKNTVSFSHVKTFLGNKRDNISFIINYYDELKNLEFHKDNSFFWLQYSIACMNYRSYDLAQEYVDVAYDLFRNDGYNVPFQCDNQQARLLLCKIRDEKSKNVLDDFEKAHHLAMKPRKNEKDREESVIRLFNFYIDDQFVNCMKKTGNYSTLQKACADAYNRVESFLMTMRNIRDKERYEKLKKSLLKFAVAQG